MKGYPFDLFNDELSKVRMAKEVFPKSLLRKVQTSKHFKRYNSETTSLTEVRKRVPFEYESVCDATFDEVVRARFSYFAILTSECERVFDEEPRFRFAYKIRSSFATWGRGLDAEDWNDFVRAYDAIRYFTFQEEDFSVTLDWARGYHALGWSESSHVFLDGAFALLLHYKQEHVMTIGFSPISGRRILIHQIQLVKKKGNRFLYTLEKPYMSWVLEKVRHGFPTMEVSLIGSESVVRSVAMQYREIASRYRYDFKDKVVMFRYHCTEAKKESVLQDMKKAHRDFKKWVSVLSHFHHDVAPRLRTLYEPHDIRFGKSFQVKKLTFRPVLVSS
jgi:hypothetical protein